MMNGIRKENVTNCYSRKKHPRKTACIPSFLCGTTFVTIIW